MVLLVAQVFLSMFMPALSVLWLVIACTSATGRTQAESDYCDTASCAID